MKTFVLIACLLIPVSAMAQMYRWVDDQGRTHYSQTLESIPEKFRGSAAQVGQASPRLQRVPSFDDEFAKAWDQMCLKVLSPDPEVRKTVETGTAEDAVRRIKCEEFYRTGRLPYDKRRP